MSSCISKLKFAVAITAILIPAFVLSSPVWAVELMITGNGSSSDSQITITSTSTTTVEQTGQANIQNDVRLDLNTGGNSASGNSSADTSVTTGDISSQTNIGNKTNSSTASLDCCPQPPSTITITDNGSDSQNMVNFTQNSDTQANISQNAYIQNSVSGSANTGGNQVNNNSGGNTSIATGNINVNLNVENKNINSASASVPQVSGNVNIKIAGNGSSSNNLANVFLNNNLNINIGSKADILNNSIWDLITGKNQASGNTGGIVYIATGGINWVSEIINGPINTSLVILDCCKIQGNPDDPGNPNPPGNPGNPRGGPDPTGSTLPQPVTQSQPLSSAGPGSSPSANGQVLAATAAGQILPATGVSWTTILTLVSLIMFMLGLYLRLHPGQDPGKVATHV